jgi:serine/threonine protein kinase
MNSLSDFTNFVFINEGENGLIYKATNKKNNKIYVIKAIKDNNNRVLIEREKNLLKNESHQNIIRHYSSFVENNINFFVLEFFDGENLEHLSNKYKSYNPPKYIPESLIIIILKGVINGLIYLHNRNIMHRDITPDNIMIDNNNVVKITDFGISKKCNNLDELAKGSLRGKTHYTSPEISKAYFKGQQYTNYNFKTDIFSLGVTMFNIMTFDFPLNINKKTKTFERNENFIDPNIYNRKLIELVESMLIFDENLRPSSLDLYNEMRKLIGDKMMSSTYHIQQNEINLKNNFGIIRSAFSTVILYFLNVDKIKDYFQSNLVKDKIKEKISPNLRIVINSFAEILNNFEDKNNNRSNLITKFIVKISQKILIFKDEDEAKITPKLVIRILFEYFYYAFNKTKDIFIYNNKNAYILYEKIKDMPNIDRGLIEKINEFILNYANIFSDTFYFPILKKISCPICNEIEDSIEIIYDIEFPQYGNINQLLEEYQSKNSIRNYNNKICKNCYALPMNFIETKSLIIAPNILIFHFNNGAKLEEYIEIKEYINCNNKVLYKIDAIINLSINNIYNIAIYNAINNNWIYYYNEKNNSIIEFNKVIENGKICIAFYKIYKNQNKDY